MSDMEHDWEKFYKLKEGDTFVELGAFKGKYVKHTLNKGAKVIAVEPLPDAIRELERIGNPNLTIIPKAVWTERGKIVFGNRLGDDGTKEESRVTSLELASTSSAIMVDCDTLDNIGIDLKIGEIDLLAADIENSEKVVFFFGKELLKRTNNVAIAVYHDSENQWIIENLLTSLGFRILDKGAIIYGTKM